MTGIYVFIKSIKGKVTPPWGICNVPCCFADGYGNDSLNSFVKGMADEVPKQQPILPLFDPRQGHFNNQRWREGVLETAQEWYRKARQLQDQQSFVAHGGIRRSIRPFETNGYIMRLRRLVDFAKVINILEAEIDVWGLPWSRASLPRLTHTPPKDGEIEHVLDESEQRIP